MTGYPSGNDMTSVFILERKRNEDDQIHNKIGIETVLVSLSPLYFSPQNLLSYNSLKTTYGLVRSGARV